MLRDAAGTATGVQLDNGEVKEAEVVVVNADLVWAYNNLFTKDGAQDKQSTEGAGAVQKVKEGVRELLDPRKAKRMLGKPHSYVSSPSVADIAHAYAGWYVWSDQPVQAHGWDSRRSA